MLARPMKNPGSAPGLPDKPLSSFPQRLTAADIEAGEHYIGTGYGMLTPGGAKPLRGTLP